MPEQLEGLRLTCVQTAQGDKRAGAYRLWRFSVMQVRGLARGASPPGGTRRETSLVAGRVRVRESREVEAEALLPASMFGDHGADATGGLGIYACFAMVVTPNRGSTPTTDEYKGICICTYIYTHIGCTLRFLVTVEDRVVFRPIRGPHWEADRGFQSAREAVPENDVRSCGHNCFCRVLLVTRGGDGPTHPRSYDTASFTRDSARNRIGWLKNIILGQHGPVCRMDLT